MLACRRSGALLIAVVGLAALVAGCGIGWGSGSDGTELFAQLGPKLAPWAYRTLRSREPEG